MLPSFAERHAHVLADHEDGQAAPEKSEQTTQQRQLVGAHALAHPARSTPGLRHVGHLGIAIPKQR